MDESMNVFAKMPVPKAVAKNALPAIVSMLVVLIYNIADTFFVGQTGSALQVAAVSITTPVFLILMAVGTLFGIGGTSVISRALGEGRTEYAKQVSSFCFYASIAVGLILMLVLWLFMDGLLALIGVSPDTIGYARDYLSYIAISAPFVILSNAFSNIVRAEGKSTTAMLGMLLGTVVNIILDPIMILTMNLGVTGAAIATVLGNVAGALFYVFYFFKKTSILSISPRDFRFRDRICTGVLAIGIPASLNSILMSLSNIILNNLLARYGDIPVAAMGVAMKVNLIIVLLLLGLGQGIQPLLGYNYGARNVERFRGIMRFSLLCSVVLGVILTVACSFGAGPLVQAFIDHASVYEYGVSFVKALMLSGPFIGILFVCTNALQAMGAALPSLFLSISRQGFVFIPLLFLLNALIGLTGIIYAQAVADYVSILLSILLYFTTLRKIKAKMQSEPLPESAPLPNTAT